MSAPPLKALVMTGGFSRRMGRDKALVEYHGMSQVSWTASLLSRICDRVYLSCRRDQNLGDIDLCRYERIHDRVEGLGPMGGLSAAHALRPQDAWLAVACDLPRLDEETLQTLVAARDSECIATAFRSNSGGLPEPLCAIYEPAAFALVQRSLDSGKRCPRKLLIDEVERVRLVDLPHPDALDNINTPDEEHLFRRL